MVEVRGEVVLPRSTFAQWTATATTEAAAAAANRTDADAPQPFRYSNARNATSGILLRQKDSMEEEMEEVGRLRSSLRFYAYGLAAEGDGDGQMFGSDAMEQR